MCVNKYYVINPYTRKGLYVNCGKCKSCLTEKAIHRVRRIKNTYTDALDCMMVTLTYSRGTAPYIDRSEAYNFAHGRLPYLNVYRDSSFRRKRVGSSYEFEYKRTNGKNTIFSVPSVGEVRFDGLKDLKYENGKIGVAYYPDVQRFVSRLRINLKRLFNYENSFKTFCCSEYGSKSLRPHFHLLIFFPKGDYETLRSAIFKSWPFADLQSFDRSVEKCYRGASYVASYVNCGCGFPLFLQSYFKPKHSYSKGFGLGNRFFNLRSIFRAYERGSLTYSSLQTTGKCDSFVTRVFPKYVIHRYFPKFKGYSRIDPVTLYDNLRRLAKGDFDAFNESIKPLYLSYEECRKVFTRLYNAVARCYAECPDLFDGHLFGSDNMFDEYYRLHVRIWNLYNSCLIRQNMENDDLALFEKYDNLDVVKSMLDYGIMQMPVGFDDSDFIITDPNKFPHNVFKTNQREIDFNEHIKHRNVTNVVLSSLYEEF